MKCPYCNSDQIHIGKKGYSIGKGLVGTALVGFGGLLGGLFGSNKIIATCLACGKTFSPQEGVESELTQRLKDTLYTETGTQNPSNLPKTQDLGTENAETGTKSIDYYIDKHKRKKSAKYKTPSYKPCKVAIATLLELRNAINDSKVRFLEDCQSEGITHVEIPKGELEILRQLAQEENPIKRMLQIKPCEV